MSKKTGHEMDMLHGPLAGRIFLFALPLAISSILQQLFNSADVAVVGRFAGSVALAAVGANSPVVSLFVGGLTGLATGVNVVIAQLLGRGEAERTEKAVHTAMCLSVIAGLIIMAVGLLVAGPLLTLIGCPEEVLAPAVLYLRIYLLGLPALSVYNFGAAILRSAGDTTRPTICLVIAGVLNIFLNLLLVIVFHLGVAGVAIATDISALASCLMVVHILRKEPSQIRFFIRRLRIDGPTLRRILVMGIPSAIQGMVFCFSNVCIQSGINSFGTEAIAGSAAALNFEYFNFYAVTAFNTAAVTFVGQNYAAGSRRRCKRVYRDCFLEALASLVLMEIVYFALKTQLLGLFSADPAVIEYAMIRMKVVLTLHFLICTYEVTGSVLRGMGHSLLPAVLTTLGSVVFRVLWILTVFARLQTFEGLMLVYPFSWVLTGTMMLTAYLLVGRPALKEE